MPMTVRYTVLDGEILSETRNGVEHDYVPDPLGSTVALLDNTQTPTDTFTYWPYGEVNTRFGSTATPFQFVGTRGYYRDSASRDYARNRVLDKARGRWLTQDPIGFRGGDWNLYRYVKSNPASHTDALGLRAKDYGDSFCRNVYRSRSWHSCSESQWSGCITKCGGFHNVNYCCAKSDAGTGDCHCIHPPKPRKPRNPIPYPGFGDLRCKEQYDYTPPKPKHPPGFEGPFFPIDPIDPTHQGGPPQGGSPPVGSFGGSVPKPGAGDWPGFE